MTLQVTGIYVFIILKNEGRSTGGISESKKIKLKIQFPNQKTCIP